MRETIESISTAAQPGFNAFLEDVFGLSVRGLRTLSDLYARPKRVFDNARVIDWANQHTPTIRLTFSLITVFMLLSFFWSAEDGPLYQGLYSQLEVLRETQPDLPPAEVMIEGWFAAYSFSYPFIYMILQGLFGSFLFVWGKGTPWTTRLRMYFGLCAIGMSIALLTTTLLTLIKPEQLLAYTALTISIGLIAYALTYARAMAGTLSVRALIWRTPFVAFYITLIDFLIGGVSVFASGVWVGYQGAQG